MSAMPSFVLFLARQITNTVCYDKWFSTSDMAFNLRMYHYYALIVPMHCHNTMAQLYIGHCHSTFTLFIKMYTLEFLCAKLDKYASYQRHLHS
jgi:hypothetical protein